MQRLKVGENKLLTEDILKVLAKNRITTILEFLQEDSEKLSTLTKLSITQVLDIRSDILHKYSALLVSGTVLLQNILKEKCIRSGIPSFDEVTGGIPVRFITEVCGLADSGKTQLCLQLAINCAKNTEKTVLYVDTKGDFSAIRIQKILDASGYSFREMAQIMFKIRIVHIWTMDEILELFKKLKNRSIIIENLGLIIIDSLASLMFQYLGDENKVGLTFLNTLVNYARYLGKEMDMGIICVNIQTRWVEQDIFDIDDDGEQSAVSKDVLTERRNRCLGKYWQHIPALVLLLEKLQTSDSKDSNSICTNLIVVKSSGNKCYKKCVLKISNLGVT